MNNDTESATLAVTRVANSCVLIEIDGRTVLTDPFFTERWLVRRGEPLGLTVAELPPLTAIVASHSFPNHWDLRALAQYRHKSTTSVYVSSARMARQARALGYASAELLPWHAVARPEPGVSVEAAPAGRTAAWRHNAYVIECGGIRVFFGGEIRDAGLLARYRHDRPAVDVALLPVNGLRPVVGPPIVMGPEQAVAGAKALGARILVPVHDAMGDEPFARVLRRHGSGADARDLALADPTAPRVVCLPTGRRWEYEG